MHIIITCVQVLVIQGFLVCRKHADRLVLMVRMMSKSGLPCFKVRGSLALSEAKRRLSAWLVGGASLPRRELAAHSSVHSPSIQVLRFKPLCMFAPCRVVSGASRRWRSALQRT